MNTIKPRPARRIPADRLEQLRAASAAQQLAKQQAEEDAARQLISPTPVWSAVPRLSMVPGGLYWSGPTPVPAVGEPIIVEREGGPTGPAKVAGYFHADGFLGIVADFEKVPLKLTRKPRATCVFGRQFKQAA